MDASDFESLYQEHARAIYHFCLRRLNDPHDAEDIASRVFLKALNARHRFHPDPHHPGQTLRAWLYRIARNELIDTHRTRRRHASLDALTVPDPSESPEHRAITNEANERLHRLLAALPDNQRAVIELRMAGLKGEEIASTPGVSLSAVKSLQFRGYRTLRGLLIEQPAQDGDQ